MGGAHFQGGGYNINSDRAVPESKMGRECQNDVPPDSENQVSDDGLNEASQHKAVAVTITYSLRKQADLAQMSKERKSESHGLLVPH